MIKNTEDKQDTGEGRDMIQITAYTDTGVLTIATNGKRYKYFGVSPSVKEDVERRSKHGQVGQIMKLLATFSRTDLFEKKEDGR